jgi:ATP-dependent Clp protease ATP-binding subunit ClpC
VFERFTPPALEVVVHAQDEARALSHDHIGTEHFLLGLLRQTDTIASRALGSLGAGAELVREQVVRAGGRGDEVTTGQIPFTARAMKTLELASREASTLGHHFVGTEHVLLGLARLGDGVAARILAGFDASPRRIAESVMAAMGSLSTDAGREYAAGFPPPIEPEDSGADL